MGLDTLHDDGRPVVCVSSMTDTVSCMQVQSMYSHFSCRAFATLTLPLVSCLPATLQVLQSMEHHPPLSGIESAVDTVWFVVRQGIVQARIPHRAAGTDSFRRRVPNGHALLRPQGVC